ncbi:cell division protein [Sphingobacterium sp. ML3W]|uniref:SRPBCC family protein n=1 Tax=Sphingobacterium sp. ML3W TaxID=1538644 RepID=UPI0004F5ADEB|nr:SRPBCC family protein [Sphingobacterium sp. ML3W]AIM37203.1 cell division protein [Sphingobacterium sp. ML3W]
MPSIEIITEIDAPINICFDLARSIDLHTISTSRTNEHAIDGRTTGLIGLNELVTWQATHFGIRQKLTSKITAFDSPHYFVDEQVKGAFTSLYHEHIFEQVGEKVIMKDIFEFQSPFGIFGRLFNHFILTDYLTQFRTVRNNIIKEYAESDKWKMVI